MQSLIILLTYYWLITFSLVGYGILLYQVFLKSSDNDFKKVFKIKMPLRKSFDYIYKKKTV